MTPDACAALHARGFDTGRPWSPEEFAALLGSPHVFSVGDETAFALGRAIAGEAELLTLVTDPAFRRRGLARERLRRFEEEAQARGAATAFLEVAEDNAAARALYGAAGYAEAARRPGYYPRGALTPADALVLTKRLGSASAGAENG